MKDYQMLNLLGRSQTDLYISHWTLSRLFGAHSHHNEYICKIPTLKNMNLHSLIVVLTSYFFGIAPPASFFPSHLSLKS